VIGKKL